MFEIIKDYEYILEHLMPYLKTRGINVQNLFLQQSIQNQFVILSEFIYDKFDTSILRTKYEICIIYTGISEYKCIKRQLVRNKIESIREEYMIAIKLACDAIIDPLNQKWYSNESLKNVIETGK